VTSFSKTLLKSPIWIFNADGAFDTWILDRSKNLPADSLFIDEKAFEKLLQRFEPLGADEEHKLIIT